MRRVRTEGERLQLRADIALTDPESFVAGIQGGRLIAAEGLKASVNRLRAEAPDEFIAYIGGQTEIIYSFYDHRRNARSSAYGLGLMSGLKSYAAEERQNNE